MTTSAVYLSSKSNSYGRPEVFLKIGISTPLKLHFQTGRHANIICSDVPELFWCFRDVTLELVQVLALLKTERNSAENRGHRACFQPFSFGRTGLDENLTQAVLSDPCIIEP